MDIVSRKLSFVQEFLRISDEKILYNREQLLHSEKNKNALEELYPLTMDEFNKIIDQSEDDFQNGRITEARELFKKVETWE